MNRNTESHFSLSPHVVEGFGIGLWEVEEVTIKALLLRQSVYIAVGVTLHENVDITTFGIGLDIVIKIFTTRFFKDYTAFFIIMAGVSDMLRRTGVSKDTVTSVILCFKFHQITPLQDTGRHHKAGGEG